MNRLFLLCSLFLALFVACDDDPTPVAVPVIAEVSLPVWVSEDSVMQESVVFRNVSSAEVFSFSSCSELAVVPGLYDVTYMASVVGGRQITFFLQNVEITGNSVLAFNAHDAQVKRGLVIREIFFTGSQYESGKSYYGDQYVVIYNNSDSVIYADGVALLESKLRTSSKYELTPNFIPSHFIAHAVYVVPGSGSDHPLAPGESLLLCDVGIDHRAVNPRSIDLSMADFEWFDVSASVSTQDIDSETVPNLDKWCCYTNSIWILHNRGHRAYALARMNTSKEAFLSDFSFDYDYVNVTSAGTFEMSDQAWKVPNEWLLDVVQCASVGSYLWSVVNPVLDRGFTFCGEMDNDKTRFFKSVCRKVERVLPDGREILADTNNSSEDFAPNCLASLFAK